MERFEGFHKLFSNFEVGDRFLQFNKAYGSHYSIEQSFGFNTRVGEVGIQNVSRVNFLHALRENNALIKIYENQSISIIREGGLIINDKLEICHIP